MLLKHASLMTLACRGGNLSGNQGTSMETYNLSALAAARAFVMGSDRCMKKVSDWLKRARRKSSFTEKTFFPATYR
jgi:hypothetical protein